MNFEIFILGECLLINPTNKMTKIKLSCSSAFLFFVKCCKCLMRCICLPQIMLLETSRRYNPSIDSITFLKDFSYNKEDFAKAGEFAHFSLSNVLEYIMLGVSETDCLLYAA